MLNLRSILIAFLFLRLLAAQAETGADIIKASGVKSGFIVHLGCGEGDLTMQLSAGKQCLAHGLDTNSETVQQARLNLAQMQKFGKVTAGVYDGEHLLYAENLVSLIVVSDAAKVSRKEILRVLAPLGVILQKQKGDWVRTAKPWPTHFLHGPNNNAVVQDTEVSAPRLLQWVGAPRFSRSHEEMASFSACVTTQGRLFYIVDEAQLRLESRRFQEHSDPLTPRYYRDAAWGMMGEKL
jgi:SAM-dependent methyltransferase|tara:strand:+ start:672 stop:1385 length:714 start_codon:yes stop_codon:yes gene_type:complete